ncbi:unnamed protein product [Paramecium primaurelia]|uniref:Uncharacterized protein n=1 Tax=Paramecium primaurelia TaxID=5886 RepID=A0A8S1Q7P7_PARPR|nr:unnamed protein product [Paramecium primaurelia]
MDLNFISIMPKCELWLAIEMPMFYLILFMQFLLDHDQSIQQTNFMIIQELELEILPLQLILIMVWGNNIRLQIQVWDLEQRNEQIQ